MSRENQTWVIFERKQINSHGHHIVYVKNLTRKSNHSSAIGQR